MHFPPRFRSFARFSLALLAVVLALPAGHAHDATLHATVNGGQLEAPGAAFDADGNLYVGQYTTGVFKITPAGGVSLFSPTPALPRQIVFHNGALYVADFDRNIYKITTDGTATIHATVAAASNLNGLAADEVGNLYASDITTHAIYKITPNGTSSVLVSEVAVNSPTGLAFNSGVLYAADGSKILAIDPSTGAVTPYATAFALFYGLAFDAAGLLYVADSFFDTISRVSDNGNTVTAWSSGYTQSRAVAFDSAQNLYVVELGGNIWRTDAPPTVTSIVRADANPTTAGTVDFTVTFSASVTGVDVSDFVLTTTGLADASIASVSADSGTTRTVTVNTGTGSGTLRLDVVDDDTIVSNAVPLGGAGAGNGSFSTGEAYSVRLIDLSIALTDSPDPVNAGADLTYTLTLSNVGGGAAPDPSVSLPLPTGTTFVSLSAPGGWSASTPAIGANGTVTVSHTSLAAGASGVFTLVVNVDPATASNSTFTATATASTSGTDVDTDNDTATATTTTATSADLGVTISGSPEIAPASGTVIYTITVTNHGPSPVSPAVLATLSGNIALNAVDVPSDWATWEISETERLFGLFYASDRLASGESAELTITVDVTSATPGARLALNAYVDSFVDDPVTANDDVTLRSIVGPAFTPATATALTGVATGARVTGNLHFPGKVDAYSFSAHAGDRVYAATATTASSDAANASRDTVLTILRSDGSTVMEYDDDDGGQSSTASSIAGLTIPADGTYYVLVECMRPEAIVFPYDLYVRVQSGSPATETVASATTPGQTLTGARWVSGALDDDSEVDTYTFALSAGETLFASLDLDPERDGTGWDGKLRLNRATTPGATFDVNGSDLVSDTPPSSEALLFTALHAGNYSLAVSSADGSFGNYRLSVSVLPAPAENPSTTYTATIADGLITDASTLTSTITIPANQRIGRLKVALNLTHTNLPDLDVHLTAPDGNTVGLFRDVGDTAQTSLDVLLDDGAAYAIGFAQTDPDTPLTNVGGASFKPGRNYRLGWFAGQSAQGTWTLSIRDRSDDSHEGILNSWSLTVVDEDPLPTDTETVRFSTDFESSDGGFTHSGTTDEWAHGTPSAAPIASAYRGTKAWKTDLTGGYDASGTHTLVSPNIDLTSVPGSHPVVLSWAMAYQLGDASTDKAHVEVQEVGGTNLKRVVWRWLGPAMRDTNVGTDGLTIEEAAGWGLHRVRLDDFRGKTIRILFHLESDGSDEFAGLAIDDVAVKSYGTIAPPPPPPPTPASVTLSGLNVRYDGTPKPVSVTTSPGGLSLYITYDGRTTAPTAIGTYAVYAEVTSSGYEGYATGTLVIDKALPPVITQQPPSVSVTQGGSATLAVAATGAPPLTYQWLRNGVEIPGATSASLTLSNVQPAHVGFYTVLVTGGGSGTLSHDARVELAFSPQVTEGGVQVLTDVRHPNGNVYDQILVTGATVSAKPKPAQVVRLSFLDLSDDIVQVEFSGAGTVTLSLANASGPAAPVNYRQPGVAYMKGHATIEITGADASSHLTIFSVGKLTAINQSLFRDDIAYDGVADLALVTISSTDGKFDAVRTGNVSYFNTSGFAGIYAPGVDLTALNIGDLNAADNAIPVLITGAVDTVRITGGSLEQANGAPIEVGGVARVQFVDGTTSHGDTLPAQPNRATFSRDGIDVTTDLVR